MWKRKEHLCLALAASLCACATYAVRQPQTPQQPSVYYLEPAQFGALHVPPPPAVGSEGDKDDFAVLLRWQAKRTPEECARARSEAHAYFLELFGNMSPFAKPLPSEVADFFERVHADTDAAVGFFKNRYKRPRPFVRDSRLEPCLGKINGKAYPGGHAAVARMFALILSDLEPDMEDEFLARADEAGLDRVIGGVHYPSDIEAGKRLADGLYKQMKKIPDFRADMKMLRGYLADGELSGHKSTGAQGTGNGEGIGTGAQERTTRE